MLGDKNKMASQLNMSQEDDDNSLGVEWCATWASAWLMFVFDPAAIAY
jgi:hypothetical protein